MSKRQLPQPTEAELLILNILWERGPSTVRQVHDALSSGREARYTTTLKQLQVMAEKGIVKRNEDQRSHVYTAAVDEGQTKQTLVSQVIDRVFEGSVRKMVLHALEARDISEEELKAIKRIVREREKKGQ